MYRPQRYVMIIRSTFQTSPPLSVKCQKFFVNVPPTEDFDIYLVGNIPDLTWTTQVNIDMEELGNDTTICYSPLNAKVNGWCITDNNHFQITPIQSPLRATSGDTPSHGPDPKRGVKPTPKSEARPPEAGHHQVEGGRLPLEEARDARIRHRSSHVQTEAVPSHSK